MIGQIVSSIVGLGTSYLDSKSQIQKAKAVIGKQWQWMLQKVHGKTNCGLLFLWL